MAADINVSLPGDRDGFISKRCPSCARRFKARTDIERLEHCVYCGATSSAGWYTEEQEAYILAVACEQGVDPMLEEFGRELEQINVPGSPISFSAHFERTVVPPKPVESNSPMNVFTSACCGVPVKYDGVPVTLNCVACGNSSAC
jgi:hypothetical protein